MKIEAKTLKKFLEQLKMEGSASVNEVILDFAEDGLRGKAFVVAKTVYLDGRLNKSAFKNYAVLGPVGIRDLGTLITCIGNSEGIVEIKKDKNVIVISATNRVVKIISLALEFIEKAPEGVVKKLLPEIKGSKFTIDISIIKSFFTDVRAIGSSQMRIEGTKNGLVLSTRQLAIPGMREETEANSIVQTYELEVPNFTINLGINFIDAISRLDGEVVIYAKTDKPLLVYKKDEIVDIAVIVVPLGD